MACMTVFVHEAAMATTELKRAVSQEVCIPWPTQQKPEHKALRMSWVVVTDEHGKRHLRSLWKAANESSR